MEPSSRGDAASAEPDSSVNRGGVGNNRCANKLIGEGTKDKGEAQGEAGEDNVMSVGENILEVHWSIDFVGEVRSATAS
jgi:hypothetical protein